MKITEQHIHDALTTIVKTPFTNALNYAYNYARAGLSMTGDELRVQCLYVLNNIQHWRGPVAKEVRQVLKEFTK